MPHARWVRTENVDIPSQQVSRAADLIVEELGEDGVKQIGGREWWQWRRKHAPLRAEWVEMRSDYKEWKRKDTRSRRVMLYVHGGGYFFGSVDEHRYQLQRHARKLEARVIAPRYRLAPQFPFPCGLQDCLAVYLYLLTIHDATEIVLAGDSAGGGMILSMMCLLRDRGLPLPAGAILISPWVDLTHSFPSVSGDNPFDYIPPHGFHHKPSASWPPPNVDDLNAMNGHTPSKSREATFIDKSTELAERLGAHEATQGYAIEDASQTEITASTIPGRDRQLSVEIDGKLVTIKDQVQMYTTNQLLAHPLVSPVLQPSLGGLPPLLILTGGGEMLRDEQIYMGHKAANPQKYPLGEAYRSRYDPGDEILNKYKPTPVQLQVWEDLCHVAPTLSFTRPAKFMYRSIAQFGAWALARAQNRPIEIMEDDNISVISSDSESDTRSPTVSIDSIEKQKQRGASVVKSVGKAGEPLPVFVNHMIRQRVDRHGIVFPLAPAHDLPATRMTPNEVGVVKPIPIKRWIAAKQRYDMQYADLKRKVQRRRLEQVASGQRIACEPGEQPPPSALAGRRTSKDDEQKTKLRRSMGLAMWSGWGSKHDKHAVQREEDSMQSPEDEKHEHKAGGEAVGIVPELREPSTRIRSESSSRTRRRSIAHPAAARDRSRRRTISVVNQGQTEGTSDTLSSPTSALDTPTSAEQDTTAQDNLISTPPTTATMDHSAQHLSPSFYPKFKAGPSNLRALSGDNDEAASMTTGRSTVLSDEASTTAMFNAPGVITQSPAIGRPTSSATDQMNNGSRAPSRTNEVVTGGETDTHPIKDHVVDGYDTPASRGSVERLLSHQTSDEMADPGNQIDGVALSSSLQHIRSPSSTAIVKSEGVAGVVAGGSHDETSNGNKLEALTVEPTLDGVKNRAGEQHPTQRPGLYDREGSEFQTALEGG